MVRTLPFQGENTGSIPVGTTDSGHVERMSLNKKAAQHSGCFFVFCNIVVGRCDLDSVFSSKAEAITFLTKPHILLLLSVLYAAKSVVVRQ